MNELSWWQRGVIYQIYPRSFQDSSGEGVGGDGVGDLRGVTARLDYLASLGIEAVWLSPVFPSPMKDFGYDVADYCDIDPLFGTLEDFDELVAQAHARGLKVMLDWVPNHSSDEHPWFKESRRSRDNPKRDWYIWRDTAPDGGPPTNWTSFFGGPAWTLDQASGQYYLHQFLPSQPELNWANPELRAAMKETLRFWLRRGVDGFRMDVLWLLGKDQKFLDEPVNPAWDDSQIEHNSLMHVYTQDLPVTHSYVHEIRRVLDEFGDRMMVGEIYLPISQLVAYAGTPEAPGTHLPFNFHLILTPWNAQQVGALIDEYEVAVQRSGSWPNWVLGNHDQHRFRTRVGDAQYRVAQTLLLTLRGTPTVYYGDEIGMRNVPIPHVQMVDPAGLQQPGNPEAGRDPERTPMQWDSSEYAGFSTVAPWLPLAADSRTVNVAAQDADPGSDLNYFRALTRLRRDFPALTAGTYTRLDSGHPEVLLYAREHAGQRLMVALNFGAQAVTLPVQGQALLSSLGVVAATDQGEMAQLRGNEALILG